jgi:hypothetical protein
MVAVEAMTFGRTSLPEFSHAHRASTAVSYSAVSVPRGPLIRCSSS